MHNLSSEWKCGIPFIIKGLDEFAAFLSASGYDSPVDIRKALELRALDAGFDLVGIAPATPGSDLDFARKWVERGYGGQMRYLANPKRFDPAAVLPGVKSVICVGLVYDTPFPYSTEAGSRRMAESRKKESEVRSQEPEATNEVIPRPSPLGRGWSDAGGPGEGIGQPASSFQFPVSTTSPRAWISRYAWGRDYHEIMREKLERLRRAIEELAPGAETRVYVDTGPVVERAFARFSGLGWMGKNTCIINERKGSWFFLGVILTNLALEPGLPASDRCGTCRACLDACPTGALVEPYVMDASRCISYLTIELKGSIPLELRPGIGVNVFGCDICQDVCPWNSKGRDQVSGARCQERGFEPMAVSYQPSVVSEKQPETGNWKLESGNSKLGGDQPSAVSRQTTGNLQSSIFNHQFSAPSPRHPEPSTFSLFSPPLEALAAMTEDEFRRTFARSPIKRAKYRGWLRNLCVAMGNSGDTRFVPWLQELCQHPDPIVREHADWALCKVVRGK
jgi:epoxyqueuosine reductase